MQRTGYTPYVPSAVSGQQLNYKDTNCSSVPLNNQTPFLLNGLVQGSTANDRYSRHIINKGLQIHMFYSRNALTIPTAVRWIVFVDRMPNGSTPSIADVWQTGDPNDFKNMNNRARFKILKTGMDYVQAETLQQIFIKKQGEKYILI